MKKPKNEITYADLTEKITYLEEPAYFDPNLSQNLSQNQWDWINTGVVFAPKLLPDELIKKYLAVRQSLPKDRAQKHNYFTGWQTPVAFMFFEELKELCLYKPLTDLLEEIVGEPMGLHLNLTNLVSTERNFHSDGYLNPPKVNSWYAAVWMALDDIHPDSGPFEYVPGSQRWPTIRREKLFSFLDPAEIADDNWPANTQDFVARACEEEIAKREAKKLRFLPMKGDVLVWHPYLLHRGTVPNNPSLERHALIAHYSSIHHRPDFASAMQYKTGGWYFPFQGAKLS